MGFVADQDAGPRGVFVDFFGVPSSTHQGAAVYCLKYGAPILVGLAVRCGPDRIIIEHEILRYDHLKGVTEENIRTVTQAFTAVLEKWIRKYPEHYNWMHRRWKTTPPQ